jgi:hypothetical protein
MRILSAAVFMTTIAVTLAASARAIAVRTLTISPTHRRRRIRRPYGGEPHPVKLDSCRRCSPKAPFARLEC